MARINNVLELLLCVVSVGMILLCPYTKVEESFNLQALHDLLYHGRNIENFDHLEFPGVVPRTFLGPITISIPSYPLIKLIEVTMETTKFIAQYIIRFVLGLVICGAFIAYSRAIQFKFGPLVCRFLYLITLSQFHFLFYSSRPLPNTFALALALLAFRFWLLQNSELFIWTSGAAIILFRFELAILFGLILILELVSGRLKLDNFLYHVIPAGITCLIISVLVDSYYWQRWLWPEGEVFWYNTILNKSSNWGTSPIWWYFTSALPRSLLLSIFFIPWGIYTDRRTLTLLCPTLGFVCLYSLLPHKELRFIIYTIPLLNTIAAAGYTHIWRNRRKLYIVFPTGAICSLVLSCGLSLLFLTVSYYNYPGGHAFYKLHQLAQDKSSDHVSVHIGVEAAMTGVSRFGEIYPSWNYSKVEDLAPGSPELLLFDFLLISATDHTYYTSSHYLIHKEVGFTRLALTPRQVPPLNIILEDKIYVLKRKGCDHQE